MREINTLGWNISEDLGAIYIQHIASLDMLILDMATQDVIEDDLNGRKIPHIVSLTVADVLNGKVMS
jgi:hypothetical protein